MHEGGHAQDGMLEGLLGMDEQCLTDLMADEFALARKEAARSEARMLAYLDDLAAVLRMPCGSGLRVVRHWLDAACASQRISGTGQALPALAALFDYARDRMADVALADPASHVRLQIEGARNWAAARNTGRITGKTEGNGGHGPVCPAHQGEKV